MNDPKRPIYEAFTVKEQVGKSNRWTQIGAVFENRDGSLSLRLDALPLGDNIQLRTPKPFEKSGDKPESGAPASKAPESNVDDIPL